MGRQLHELVQDRSGQDYVELVEQYGELLAQIAALVKAAKDRLGINAHTHAIDPETRRRQDGTG